MNDKDYDLPDDSDGLELIFCNRFEIQFRRNPDYRIEQLLQEHGQNPPHNFPDELIRLEIDLRNRANQPLDRFEFYERFPNKKDVIDEAFQHIDEIDVVFSSFPETERDDDEAIGILDGGRTDIPQLIGHYEVHEKIGSGSFGIVYRATDTHSDQTVALKFPRRRVIESQRELELFVAEAAAAKSLDHPRIVKTYGVEQVDGLLCIVQQFIDGKSLSSLVGNSTPFRTTVEIMAKVADAAAYAHQQGYVHRDLKPSNILLDSDGNPFLADFGMAVHESVQRVLKGQRCGAPGYMSPELVQGLSHQLDSRSDIWSLGVILYYLLTGRRPFDGDSRDELYDEIKKLDVRPLRMINPEIDVELQRICLHCLHKRKANRYSTADELAKDLRNWLDEPVHEKVPAPIVPKGLRSYGEEDAEFFLQLLPGPTDKNGLPDSIRFWKTRIEKTERDGSFSLGVIFGPSGCGKSSFIKAGLLPSLDSRLVKPIYVESTSGDTEVRLIKALRSNFENIPDKISLPELFYSIKEQIWSPHDKKVMIVLDQFEQWLYSADKEQESQLMDALRHCDGKTLQCIVTVRDDFWVKISTFMNELDVHLSEGDNVRRLDRFSLDHARKILAEFGRAYGRLPDDLTDFSKEHNAFLDQAIEQLSEDDRVICVRLALSAEMFKNRPWTRAELKRVGGISGIGVTFLVETFSSTNASPEHVIHFKAAQFVLEALLPPVGTNIRGHMRSISQLLAASTYENRPDRFEKLISALNTDLRLITPTDPDVNNVKQVDQGFQTDSKGNKERYFQLTHDYLVPSIRNWLTQDKRKSWRGRAALRLTELSTVWSHGSNVSHVPRLVETISILVGARNHIRTHDQKKMMRIAIRHHSKSFFVGIVAATIALVCVVFIIRGISNRIRAEELVKTLYSASPDQVRELVSDELPALMQLVEPKLREDLENDQSSEHKKTRARLALLPSDSAMLSPLFTQMLKCELAEFRLIRDQLRSYSHELRMRLLTESRETNNHDLARFNAFLAFASYEPKSTELQKSDFKFIVGYLLDSHPKLQSEMLVDLHPIGAELVPELKRRYLAGDGFEGINAANALTRFCPSEGTRLIRLLTAGSPEQFKILLSRIRKLPRSEVTGQLFSLLLNNPNQELNENERIRMGKGRANAVAALIHLDCLLHQDVFQVSQDAEIISQFCANARRLGIGAKKIIDAFQDLTGRYDRYTYMLVLGEFLVSEFEKEKVSSLKEQLLEWFKNDPSSTIHSASEWLLRKWGFDELVENTIREIEPARKYENDERNWYIEKIDGNFVTFVVFQAGEYRIGSPSGEIGRGLGESQRKVVVARPFAISTTEVTRGQFESYFKTVANKITFEGYCEESRTSSPSARCPATVVTWFDAIEFCKWASKVSNISENDDCYSLMTQDSTGPKIWTCDFLCKGYRLPSEIEWEVACRNNTVTAFDFGSDHNLLARYGFFSRNSIARTTTDIQTLRPSLSGLFDIYGNVGEWCWDKFDENPAPRDDPRFQPERILRGGAWGSMSFVSRSSYRVGLTPVARHPQAGFRLAKTLPDTIKDHE